MVATHTNKNKHSIYALCDWCVFKRHEFCNCALECESSERLVVLFIHRVTAHHGMAIINLLGGGGA